MDGSPHLAAVPSLDANPPSTAGGEPPSSDDDDSDSDGVRERTPRRPRAARALPTDRMRMEMQIDALRAFGIASNNGKQVVTNDRLHAQLPNVSAATVSLNNQFFVEMRLLSRVSKGVYKPVPAVIEFARRYDFNRIEAAHLLGPVMKHSWAYTAITNKLKMGATTRQELVESLAIVAQADKSFVPQLRTLLDWFEFAGLIRFEGEMVRVEGPLGDVLAQQPPHEALDNEEPMTPVEQSPADTAVPKSTTKADGPHLPEPPIISLNIDVAITAADLAKLDPAQIKALFEGVGVVAAIQASRP